MSIPTAQSSTRLRPAPPPVRWRSWPIVERPRSALLAFFGLALVAIVAYWITGQPHLAGMAVAALVLAGWRFYVPIWYELDVDGVHQSVLRHRRLIAWTAIGGCEPAAEGVVLLPRSDAVLFDVLAGLYLPWSNQREEVLANVRFYLRRLAPAQGE
jgi:hypothetical protein